MKPKDKIPTAHRYNNAQLMVVMPGEEHYLSAPFIRGLLLTEREAICLVSEITGLLRTFSDERERARPYEGKWLTIDSVSGMPAEEIAKWVERAPTRFVWAINIVTGATGDYAMIFEHLNIPPFLDWLETVPDHPFTIRIETPAERAKRIKPPKRRTKPSDAPPPAV